jgi:DNA invertase Pin-like site-specific DNA recombinase
MTGLEQFLAFAYKDLKVRVKGNNAVVYTRVSHHSQEDNTSLESQLKYCKSFAKKKDLNIVEYFGGTYESAKTDDRTEFKRMLKYIKQSKNISHIIVYSYERFSRSGVGGAKIAEDLLRDYGVVTLAVTQELDPTTSSGSFQQKILFLFSQMDNELRRDKTVTGMSELIRKGYTPYSIPRGFTNLNKGRCVDQNIVVNQEGKLIRKAFMWKAKQGLRNAEIVKRLKDLGMKMDLRRLAYIFENPYYCGLIVSKMIPNEVIEGKHEQLISRSIFLKVNNIVNDAKSTHPNKHKQYDENLPLKVFMRCAECDTPMTGYQVKAKGLYYYKCRTKGCKHSASAKKLHADFSQVLSMFEIDKEDVPVVKQAVTSYFSAFFEEQEENIALVTSNVERIQKQLDQVEERYALGKISDELYLKFSEKYHKELNELAPKNANSPVESSNLQKCINKALEFCINPQQWWEKQNVERKMQIQKILFPDGICLSKQNRTVLTNRINSIFAPIEEVARLLKETKKGQPINFDQLSSRVTQIGQDSNFLEVDLKRYKSYI